jgi:hypothetical protein
MSTIKNSTRKVNRIPSGETPNSISPKKTKSKSPSPNKNKTRKTMNDAISILANMDYRENPEIFDLLNTNKQYKSQINQINKLQLKIQKYQTEISEFGDLMNVNDDNMDELREKLYDDDSSSSQKTKIRKEMESLKLLKEDYLKQIDLREARIEETEFLVKIWQSTKINDNEKKKLEKEYIKEYRNFDKRFKTIQNKIDNLRNQTFEKTYPNIERTVFNEDNHEWLFDTDEKQKLFDDFNNKRNLQMYKLSEEQKKLNDEFYRGYKIEIEKKIN